MAGHGAMGWVETLAGLCGAGPHLVVAWRPAHLGALTGHPMVPVLAVQIDTDGEGGGGDEGGGSGAADVTLPASRPHEWLSLLLGAMAAVASGERAPLALRHGNVDFQLPRGGAVSL